MAYRRHIVATRNTTPEDMTAALANVNVSVVTEANGWCWAMASVWATGARDILDALADFDGPTVVTTTEDGCRWRLYLRKRGLPLYATVHEFSWIGDDVEAAAREDDWDDVYNEEEMDERMVEIGGTPSIPRTTLTPLDFEDTFFSAYIDDDDAEDEEDYSESPLELLLEEFTEYGLSVPDAIVEALQGVSKADLYPRFLSLHADHIKATLAEYEIPHDPAEVVRILTGEGVTKAEFESDVGNLWRFLEHLGLGTQFRDALDDFEEADANESNEDDFDPVAHIAEKTDGLLQYTIENGPASIPLSDASLLFRMINCQDIRPEAAFLTQFDTDTDSWPTHRVPSYATLYPTPNGANLSVNGPEVMLAPRSRARIGALLQTLPDGAKLKLIAAGEYATLRLQGDVQNGRWWLREASAPVSSEELSAMLELFRATESRQALTALSAEEADAIMDDAAHDMSLYDNLPRRDGLALKCNTRTELEVLCSLFFIRRFSHRWDFSVIRTLHEENFNDWRNLKREIDQQEALPVTDKVIFEGQVSRFLEPDYDAPSMDRAMRIKAKRIRGVDRKFSDLGYVPLGDVVCEKVGGGVLRCYANEAERTYGVHYVLPYGQTWFEFYSRCDDDTTVTTTTGLNEGSIQSLRVLVRERPQANLSELHDDHMEGLGRLATRSMEPVPITVTIEGIASEMDAFLLRRLGHYEED